MAPVVLSNNMDSLNSTTGKSMDMVTIKGKKGRKPLKFREGGLHETTHTPMGQKIPESKVEAAAHGAYGPLGVKQANFAEHALAKGRATAAKHRRPLRTK
jgi:hypothetical protein